jgi:hypothetical protein
MPSCPVCHKSFERTRFLENHLVSKACCRHALEYRNTQPSQATPHVTRVDEISDDEDDPSLEADISAQYEDLDVVIDPISPGQSDHHADPVPPCSDHSRRTPDPEAGFHDGSARATAEDALGKAPVVTHVYPGAGTVLGYDDDAYQAYYQVKHVDPANVFEPFASKQD